MRRHGKGKTQNHAGGISADGLIDKIADAGETVNSIEFFFDFFPRESQNCGVQHHVLAARKFRRKARAQLEQRGAAPVQLHGPCSRLENSRYNLKQRTLAGPVRADDAEHLAIRHAKAHIAERAQIPDGTTASELRLGLRGRRRQYVAQTRPGRVRQPVIFRDVPDFNGVHTFIGKWGRSTQGLFSLTAAIFSRVAGLRPSGPGSCNVARCRGRSHPRREPGSAIPRTIPPKFQQNPVPRGAHRLRNSGAEMKLNAEVSTFPGFGANTGL